MALTSKREILPLKRGPVFIVIFFILTLVFCTAIFAPAGDIYAQQDKKSAKRTPAKSGEKDAGNKYDKKADAPSPRAAAEKSAGGYIEKTLMDNADADMLDLINETARIMAAGSKNDGEAVKFSVYCALFDQDSNEIRYMFTKTYNSPVSVKSEYASKYNSKDYFTFESDFLGFTGYQIVSKASAKLYADMVCYQTSTDSVFLAYALPAANLPSSRPKLTMEAGFFRGAVMSAREFEEKQGYTFFEMRLLKNFKPKKGYDHICAQAGISYAGAVPLVYIYTYKNRESASVAFKNFRLTGGKLSAVNDIHQKDGGYNYYLNAANILAVSNKLYR
jgi:hypothetical protein